MNTDRMVFNWRQRRNDQAFFRRWGNHRPPPIRTAQIMSFWSNHGCRGKDGEIIRVPMVSGRIALYQLRKVEYLQSCDWQWHEYHCIGYEEQQCPDARALNAGKHDGAGGEG